MIKERKVMGKKWWRKYGNFSATSWLDEPQPPGDEGRKWCHCSWVMETWWLGGNGAGEARWGLPGWAIRGWIGDRVT